MANHPTTPPDLTALQDQARDLRVANAILTDLLGMARDRGHAAELRLAEVQAERDAWERRYRELELQARTTIRSDH